ncbi:MAG: MCE family protein [Rikenellaceae bacterium]|nr:MCE family protein [Rikenellaceae bacterium]
MKREVKVGLFALIMMFALYAMFNFFKGKNVFSNTNDYYVVYENVGGLQVSSPVDIKGMEVGVVTGIELDSESEGVRVTMQVKKAYPIPVDSRARMYSTSLMGGKGICLDLGTSSEMFEDEATITAAVEPDMLGGLTSQVGDLAGGLQTTLDKVNTTLDGVNGVIADNSAAIKGAVSNVDDITANVNRLLADKSTEIRGIVDGLNSLAANLERNSDKIDGIIADVEGITDSLQEADLRGVVDNLAVTLNELSATLASVNGGDGTVSKAINNPELYNSLVSAVDNLSVLLADLKENPKKYINVTVFGGKDKNK